MRQWGNGSEGATVVIHDLPVWRPGRLPHNLTTVTRSHCGAAIPAAQCGRDARTL